ncbi:hypothetical protein V5E97_12535 [Singulisphaera sp. Ch08]|uniref:Uncharacterized protein n=1 Tax=Singulisphaera sp. Ch08 TaxID=3120278 RepID=A0AAU7CN17_9BACT
MNRDGVECIVSMGVMGGQVVLPMVTSTPANSRAMAVHARPHFRTTKLRVEMRYKGGPARLLEAFNP